MLFFLDTEIFIEMTVKGEEPNILRDLAFQSLANKGEQRVGWAIRLIERDLQNPYAVGCTYFNHSNFMPQGEQIPFMEISSKIKLFVLRTLCFMLLILIIEKEIDFHLCLHNKKLCSSFTGPQLGNWDGLIVFLVLPYIPPSLRLLTGLQLLEHSSVRWYFVSYICYKAPKSIVLGSLWWCVEKMVLGEQLFAITFSMKIWRSCVQSKSVISS